MQNHYEPSGIDNIIVRPVYLRAVNAIVHPEVQAPCSLYFLENWLPRLGTLRWSLVLALRTMCTQRQPDGTNRGEFTRSDLARILGVHEATISRILNTTPSTIHPGWRVLQPVTNDDDETIWLGKFIPRLRYKYERDQVAAVTRRVGYVVDVVIDDPLIPDDEERLAVLLAEQLLQSSPGPSTVTAPDAPAHTGRARSTSHTVGSSSTEPDLRRAHNTARRNVKGQKASATESVNAQNASLTPNVDEQFAFSRARVQERKAFHGATLAHDAPTLTLTNNYKFRDISIDLRLSRKRDIRAAVTPLVNLAADALNDHHSKGMFFSALTQLYPSYLGVFTHALEVAEQEGQLSADLNMGAVFVNTIRQLAVEAGAELKFGQKRGTLTSDAFSPVEVSPSAETAQWEDSDDRDAGLDEGLDDEDDGESAASVMVSSEGRAPVAPTHSGSGPNIPAKQLWPSVLLELQGRTSRTNYEMWLRSCEIIGFDGDVVVIGVPSAFARDWIDQRLLGTIQSALRQVVAKEVSVRCEVMSFRNKDASVALRKKE